MSETRKQLYYITILLVQLLFANPSQSFLLSTPNKIIAKSIITLNSKTTGSNNDSSVENCNDNHNNRRNFLKTISMTTLMTSIDPSKTHAANFAPGGTLVEYDVGPQINNPEASPTRKFDNSNVIFPQDYYYKFGTGAQWIEPGSTEFPKTMPFVISQQRYDALKKYGSKITSSCSFLTTEFKDAISKSNDYSNTIPDPSTSTSYSLRSFGLLANNFLASENTGTTNELLLARYYINEIYLHILDIRSCSSSDVALTYYGQLKNAMNSYLTLMNRVISSKVGDKFDYI